jgi:uncharacterized protein YukE
MPNIPDIHWNHAVADAAIAALRRAAAELRRTAGDRAAVARQATAEWRGAHRETFDDYLRRALYEAEDLARRYDEAAARIARASERAREEQRRREREREREREEKRREQGRAT